MFSCFLEEQHWFGDVVKLCVYHVNIERWLLETSYPIGYLRVSRLGFYYILNVMHVIFCFFFFYKKKKIISNPRSETFWLRCPDWTRSPKGTVDAVGGVRTFSIAQCTGSALCLHAGKKHCALPQPPSSRQPDSACACTKHLLFFPTTPPLPLVSTPLSASPQPLGILHGPELCHNVLLKVNWQVLLRGLSDSRG